MALRRLASCDTTTCSSFVRWQSNSNMSVPRFTALCRSQEPKLLRLKLRNTYYNHITRAIWALLLWEDFLVIFLISLSKKRHVLITGQPLLPSTTQKQLCHDLNIMELRWHTSSTNHKNKHMLWNQMANFSFYTYCLNAAMVFSRFSPAPAKKKKHISVWCFGWL